MSRMYGIIVASCLLLGSVPGAEAQYVVEWPPATGYFTAVPPSYPAPGAVGAQYMETFPTFMGSYDSTGAYMMQQAVPYQAQSAPAAAARPRGRNLRAARTYSRGYNQAPAAYATPLPQGQLYWPGSYLAPAYTPYSRYQSLGSGYATSPYGSNLYPGYYKGFLRGY